MKILIIGGRRFVGLQLVNQLLEGGRVREMHVLNRHGQAGDAHKKGAWVHKGDRRNLASLGLDDAWDVVVDMATFTKADAEGSVNFFKSVKRYIFVSTASVYNLNHVNLTESEFDPSQPLPARHDHPYQQGKREAEHVFATNTQFPTVMVRFPLICGPDDYSHRLEFHLERLRERRPIGIANVHAEFSAIHSTDAATALKELSLRPNTPSGPLNVASPDRVSLGQMLRWMETSVGNPAILLKTTNPEQMSPLAQEHSWSLNTEKMRGLNLNPRKIQDWMPQLIADLQLAPTERLH